MKYSTPAPPPYRLLLALLMPAVLLIVGTLGYRAIEGWPWLDAIYMAVLILTTVGLREVHELSTAGRMFTIFLALGGIFTFFYAATTAIAGIVSGEILDFLGSRRMERTLSSLKDHMIVCGFGRMGRLVCQEFSVRRLPFVVIERQTQLLDQFEMPCGIPLPGDATDDQILVRAGVRQARAVVAVAASDADNLYITMSARLLNDQVYIVARAEDERSEQKLVKAGASRVVSPYVIGGTRVAQAILRPTVVDFLELATRTEHLELNIEEIRIASGSPLANQQLAQALGQEHKLIAVAIKQATGRMLFNPAADTGLYVGDTLIVLGRRQDLDRVIELGAGKR